MLGKNCCTYLSIGLIVTNEIKIVRHRYTRNVISGIT
jgi:hypothetical protein